jgi:RHS repeat-associated protein
MRLQKPLVLLLAILFAVTANQSSFAQSVTGATNTGYPENAVVHGTEIESVQVTNGNLHMQIPIYSAKGRELGTQFNFIYDNKGWTYANHCSGGLCTDTVIQEPGSSVVLQAVGPYDYIFSHKGTSVNCGFNLFGSLGTNYVVREPNDTKHHFAPDPVRLSGGSCSSGFPTDTLYADDGSGWMLKIDQSSGNPLYAIRKDGTKIAPSGIYTTNGNFISGGGVNKGAAGVDTLGRTVNAGGAYVDANGVLRSLVIVNQSVSVTTRLCTYSNADMCSDWSGTLTVPQTITYPNGMQYSFTYVSGQGAEIASVTLPTGAVISYSWEPLISGLYWARGGRRVISRTVSSNGVSGTWSYVYGGTTQTTVTDPALNDTRYQCDISDTCHVITVDSFNGAASGNQILKTVQTDYTTYTINGIQTKVPIRETTTLKDQSPNLISKVETDWDNAAIPGGTGTWSNPIERREYDWGSGSFGPLLRRTHYNYKHLLSSAYMSLNIADRPTSMVVYDGAGSVAAQTTYDYDGGSIAGTTSVPHHDYANYGTTFTTRGNLTKLSRWKNTNGSWLDTSYSYDDLGNKLTQTDALLHTTTFSYADSPSGACVPTAGTNAYLTQITNTLGHRIQNSYYYCNGKLQSTRDENDIRESRSGTTYTYEQLNRVSSVATPNGGLATYSYVDVVPFSIAKTVKLTSSANLLSTQVLDGMGRIKQTQLNSDPDGTVYQDSTYDAFGRAASKSNQYRSQSESTYGLTNYYYDPLGRIVQIKPPDGTTPTGVGCFPNNSCTTYSGNTVTFTDEAGKRKKTQSDSLGRITVVWEDPNGLNYETDYQYDALDNLKRVDQKGGSAISSDWRTRIFQYDSLSHLTSSSNPESGLITYSYDANANLSLKTDPRGSVSYCYDPLDRLVGKSYSSTINCGDPSNWTVAYSFDAFSVGVNDGFGRRTAMRDPSGTSTWAYNVVGRTTQLVRTIGALSKTMTYSANFDDSLASLTYPTGRTVTYTIDGAARYLSASDVANSINYVTQAHYAPHGAVSSLRNGEKPSYTGTTTTNTYNKRLQPSLLSAASPTLTVFSLSYNWNLGLGDNGNVISIQNNRDNTGRPVGSAQFTYDSLNRLLTAQSTGTDCTVMQNGLTANWGNSYSYDPWGNLYAKTSSKCTSESFSAQANTKNQLIGYPYDAAGNIANPGYTFDAEERLITAAGVTYTYDGDGRRVKKSSGKLYWFGIDGSVLAESNLSGVISKEYVYFSGKRTAFLDVSTGLPYFYFTDHLGSASVITSGDGKAVKEESDFYPFGGERVIIDQLANQYKFTGKERDTETGFDYLGARYYGSSMGRFMTPDPGNVGSHRVNPQSWNAYSYAHNRPLSLVDPNGFEPVKAQAGTIRGFAQNMNNTQHHVGETRGASATQALRSLGETQDFGPKNTAVFNMSANRYVYTANGGWVDMVHFVFYAGRAATYKAEGNSNPVGSAVQDGFHQEMMDTFKAPWSAYSYEDLSSDRLGAIFGAEFFDPTSSLTLSEQIELFFWTYLSPMAASSAPNYENMPGQDSKNPPTATNHSTSPMYTYWWSSADLNQRELKPHVTTRIIY